MHSYASSNGVNLFPLSGPADKVMGYKDLTYKYEVRQWQLDWMPVAAHSHAPTTVFTVPVNPTPGKS